MESAVEKALRLRIIDDVLARAELNGGFLTREELLEWQVEGERVPVIDFSRGIRNPANFSSTLAIVRTVGGPYDDVESSEDGLLHYAYRKGDSWGGDNRKLRNALETGVPLILFRKEIKGILTPIAPVYVVDDEPENRCFIIALDEAFRFLPRGTDLSFDQKRYALRLAKQRLHQPAFRTRVLVAYQSRCSVCELKHASLLDAAHIVPDKDPRGRPTVTNGLAMCKIHHAAFDHHMLGVSPDYQVRISGAVLTEVDGPMLKHGLQEMDRRELALPERRKDHPDREFLAERFAEFSARL
ncbi:restriction endonuclease [Pseudactinotalea sp. HY160]|nr:restriction endonuclease [Pseudactinotalea sp. HY160]